VIALLMKAGFGVAPRPDSRTAKAASLITDKQRDNFQPAVDLALSDRHYLSSTT
jgi:hypothetical protein